MNEEDRDQINAALLLNERIDERIRETVLRMLTEPAVQAQILSSGPMYGAFQRTRDEAISTAVRAVAQRLMPMYNNGTSQPSLW